MDGAPLRLLTENRHFRDCLGKESFFSRADRRHRSLVQDVAKRARSVLLQRGNLGIGCNSKEILRPSGIQGGETREAQANLDLAWGWFSPRGPSQKISHNRSDLDESETGGNEDPLLVEKNPWGGLQGTNIRDYNGSDRSIRVIKI